MEYLAEHITSIAIMAVMLVFSGFFSASETAFFSLTRLDIRALRENRPFSAAHIDALLQKPKKLLTSVLLGNMAVNVVYSTVSAVIALDMGRRFGWEYALFVELGALLLLIIFGEVVPKSVAVQQPVLLSRFAVLPLHAFQKLTFPAYKLLPILEFIRPRKGETRLVTRDEFKALVKLGGRDGVLRDHEYRMLAEIMDFSEMKIKEVMVPRVDSAFCNVNASFDEFKAIARQTKHTKFLVYEGSFDNVIGLVRAEEVFLAPEGTSLHQLVKPVQFIPEVATVEKGLQSLLKDRSHFAVVVDEYGGMAGLATLEDIIEEVVGEIEDEFDQQQAVPVRKIGEDKFIVSGNLGIRDWQEYFQTELEDVEFDTVGGFVMFLLGHIPSHGETVRYKNLKLTVRGVCKGGRINHVLIEKEKDPFEELDDE